MRTSALRRSVAASASVAIAAAGMAALAAPAQAASAELIFACPILSTNYDFKTVADTDLPATVPFGKSVPVVATALVTVPDAVRTIVAGLGAATVEGKAVVKATVNDTAITDITETVPSTAVPASGELVVNAAGAAPAFVASKLGTNAYKVSGYTATLNLKKADGTPTAMFPTVSIPCLPKPGVTQDLTFDTVEVIQATSAMALSYSGSKVTATLSSNGGTPDGAVVFTVGGKTVETISYGGKATAQLPALPTGPHPITATFTPTNAAGYTAVTVTETYQAPVVQKTTTNATAKYKASKDKATIKAEVLNADDTAATGEVKIKITKGSKKIGKATAELNAKGKAKSVFKKISQPGKYTVKVSYLGAQESKKSTTKLTFKVK